MLQNSSYTPVKKKRKNDVWLKILFGTCLEESLKANNRDGAEKREKAKYKKIMNVALYLSKKDKIFRPWHYDALLKFKWSLKMNLLWQGNYFDCEKLSSI